MAESAAVTARVRRGASRFPDSIESRSSSVAATITTAIPVISYASLNSSRQLRDAEAAS
jgi:hypothetical protein